MQGGGFVDLRFHHFFDHVAVKRRMDRRKRGLLSRAGSFVRTAARSSLKRARQKSLGEMTPAERARYEPKRDVRGRFMAQGRRRVRHRRPDRVSRPGEPPLLHMRPSPLKRLIYFAYDPAREAVVIGPLRFRSAGAEALEYGGAVRTRRRRVRIRARPFMRPALGKGLADLKRKGRTSLPRFWDNIVRS